MSQKELKQIKQEVKEAALAKIRLQWFKEYRKTKGLLPKVIDQSHHP